MSSLPETLPAPITVARTPTPIEPLARFSARLSARAGKPIELWVKRDDTTGFALGGNKVRKLEFSFARAIAEGADTVLTCGGFDSNHCRATAFLARRLGIEPVLMLRTPDGAPIESWQGNTLLSAIAGAKIDWVTPERYRTGLAMLEGRRAGLEAEGKKVFVIPEGASDPLGALGFVVAVRECAAQLDASGISIDAVVHAVGSGGTSAGLQAGRDALAEPWTVVGVPVCDDEATFRTKASEIRSGLTEEFGLPPETSAESDVYLAGGVGRGYGLSSPDELRLAAELARSEGILVDPCYTGKAFFALCRALEEGRFPAGERILFWHTGGAFANFSNEGAWREALAL